MSVSRYVLTKNLLKLWRLRGLPTDIKCVHCSVDLTEGDTVVSKKCSGRYGRRARFYCEACAEKVGLVYDWAETVE